MLKITPIKVFIVIAVLLALGLIPLLVIKLSKSDVYDTVSPAIDSEKITSNNSALESPIQPIPNSQLKYKITGATASEFLIEMKYEDSYYDYDYTVSVDEPEGYINLLPPPERRKVNVYITAISTSGEKSSPFTITNKDWWTAVQNSTSGYAAEHTFVF